MEIQNNLENSETFAKIKLKTMLKIQTILTVFDGKYIFEKYGIKPVWIEDRNGYRAIVKTSMKPNVKVFDTDGDIYVSGEWEKTIDELYYSALAVIEGSKVNTKNFLDADEYIRENFDDIKYVLDHAPRCENYICQGFWYQYSGCMDGFRAVIVGHRLIVCEDRIEEFSKSFDHHIITIYDLSNGCEECLRGISVSTFFINLSPEIYKPGKGPDGWEEYLKNYVKELKEKENTLESSEHGSKTFTK